MKIDKVSRLFAGYQPQQAKVENNKAEKAKESEEAATISVRANDEASARDAKIQHLKSKYEAGTLRYDSEKVAVALVRDLGI